VHGYKGQFQCCSYCAMVMHQVHINCLESGDGHHLVVTGGATVV